MPEPIQEYFRLETFDTMPASDAAVADLARRLFHMSDINWELYDRADIVRPLSYHAEDEPASSSELWAILGGNNEAGVDTNSGIDNGAGVDTDARMGIDAGVDNEGEVDIDARTDNKGAVEEDSLAGNAPMTPQKAPNSTAVGKEPPFRTRATCSKRLRQGRTGWFPAPVSPLQIARPRTAVSNITPTVTATVDVVDASLSLHQLSIAAVDEGADAEIVEPAGPKTQKRKMATRGKEDQPSGKTPIAQSAKRQRNMTAEPAPILARTRAQQAAIAAAAQPTA